MSVMVSRINSLRIVYSTLYSGTDQRKHQNSAPLAFVRGIHRWSVNSPHNGPVTWKMFPFDDIIMCYHDNSSHGIYYVRYARWPLSYVTKDFDYLWYFSLENDAMICHANDVPFFRTIYHLYLITTNEHCNTLWALWKILIAPQKHKHGALLVILLSIIINQPVWYGEFIMENLEEMSFLGKNMFIPPKKMKAPMWNCNKKRVQILFYKSPGSVATIQASKRNFQWIHFIIFLCAPLSWWNIPQMNNLNTSYKTSLVDIVTSRS